MESLWPQVERLLLGVSKPARYIGGEQGAQYPEHGPGKVAWMLLYPDTYEIGLPNQGLQILYEILNERPDAVAERAYAPGDVVVVVGAGTVVAVAPGTVVVVAPGTVVVVVGVPKAGLGAGAVNDGGLDGVGVFTPPIGLVKM